MPLLHSKCVFNVCLFLTQALIKQDNLDAFNEKDPYKADDSREDEDDNDDNDNSIEAETFPLERDEVMPPPIPHPPAERVCFPKGLPWAPKVRYCSFWVDNRTEYALDFDFLVVITVLQCNEFQDLRFIDSFLMNTNLQRKDCQMPVCDWFLLQQRKGHWKFPGIKQK